MGSPDTAERLLDLAQDLIQRRGWHGFSFRDLADAIGIKTASIHYHFPTKTDLGVRLMDRYQTELEQHLAAVDARAGSARARIRRFVKGYRDTLAREDCICLCGALASDITTLSDELRAAVNRYFDTSRTWVRKVVERAHRAGDVPSDLHAGDFAAALVAALQGALQFDRAAGTRRLLTMTERAFLAQLQGS